MDKEALFYERFDDKKVRCHLCPHNCLLTDGKLGICRGKKNVEGILYAINYGKLVSLGMDPMEKKPLYHFYPGSYILSTGPNSCNLKCQHCQNWSISQVETYTELVTPEKLVNSAIENKSIGLCFTYTEPLMWYEYIRDCAPLAKEKGLVNVLVTNGYINEEPLLKLLPFIDAMNIDVKSMQEDFYKKICKGKLEPVKRSVELSFEKGCHIELTNLIIPGWNDSEEELKKLIDWVFKISDKIPLHFSRYYPQYKAAQLPTPSFTLKKAYDLAKEKLKYVYVGNIHIQGTSNTYCPNCKNILIEREGYYIILTGIKDKKCNKCGAGVDMVM
jgi:pyruvate formate lyase activating enzyme